jgi:translation initiation factor 4G
MDEANSEMCARLCRKMMEQISLKVPDDRIKDREGKPVTGGKLFRKYLLNQCQHDFERDWVTTNGIKDDAVKAMTGNSVQKRSRKRRRLGLLKFFAELFKVQMLTERIMHECIKTLLGNFGNTDNPEEEEIESLCQLLADVGGILDTQRGRAHMDVYFSRMKDFTTKNPHVTSRMQFMLQVCTFHFP